LSETREKCTARGGKAGISVTSKNLVNRPSRSLIFVDITGSSIDDGADLGMLGCAMTHLPQLKKGSQGKEVAMLRSLLGLPPIHGNALFDDATYHAVMAFQKLNQLMVDGIVGPQTWFALGLVIPEVPVPAANGTVTDYRAAIRSTVKSSPRIYYVNGIQTDGPTHARTAYALSALTQRVVHGVFNATWAKGTIAGFGVDLGQCVLDWVFGVSSKLMEIRSGLLDGLADRIKKLIGGQAAPGTQVLDRAVEGMTGPERLAFCSALFLGNRATGALYRELKAHRGTNQIIVAHSQGNLITANALWSLSILDGPDALENLYVYSLASPAPAWPRGIRYKFRTYHHDNDLVVLANPHNWPFVRAVYTRAVGQYDKFAPSNGLFDPHFVYNFGDKSFSHDIRHRLGLDDIQGWVFPK